MQTDNSYLNLIDLIQLDNWSVQNLLNSKFNYSQNFEFARIGEFLIKNRNLINIEDDKLYQRVTVKINNNGVFSRDIEEGNKIGTKKQFLARSGQFIISKIDARNGAFGIIPNELDGAIVTNDFPLFNINEKRINPHFLLLITTTKEFIRFAQSCSSGTTNRQRMDIDLFLSQKIPLPSITEQNKIVDKYSKTVQEAQDLHTKALELTSEIDHYLFKELGLMRQIITKKTRGLQFVDFKDINRWDLTFLSQQKMSENSLYPLITYGELFLSLNNGIPARNYTPTGTRFLKVADIKKNHIDDSNIKFIEKFKDADYIKQNTLLITRKGTVGNSIFIKEDRKFTASSEIFIIKLNDKIDGDYLAEINLSEFVQKQYSEKNTGTIMPSLSQEKLKEILIPLPPLEKQKKIALAIATIKHQIRELNSLSLKRKKQAIQEFENIIFNY
jgi:type I restriction enzyme S subunit